MENEQIMKKSRIKRRYKKHICSEENCNNEGIHLIKGLCGNDEYYCEKHYAELVDMLIETVKRQCGIKI